MHRSRLHGEKELYPRNVVILELVYLGTDLRNFGAALREHDDRRLPIAERGDGYRADCHHLADAVHVRATPSINSARFNRIYKNRTLLSQSVITAQFKTESTTMQEIYLLIKLVEREFETHTDGIKILALLATIR